jgi:hypothetical protein
MKMKNYRKMTLVITIMALFFMGTAVGAEEKKPSGTISYDGEQFMLLIGGSSGHGTLDFKGKKYSFITSGVTAGGAGYQNMHASGNVYDLNDVNDFQGTYIVLRAGLAVVGGQGGLWLQNSNGVYIHVNTKQEGLALGTGLEGVKILFKK